ncbi:hypothetical protein NDU88_006046 [Pleurodeles waltl]|uniref:Uncharacterized protein n=1 Tax=Pleurodeles waltl TaxID=8319 RepID=A0AAV7UKE3_PLEWA|nr:hypothetical protein NDU88_006046 [Pleurodeles waltl]
MKASSRQLAGLTSEVAQEKAAAGTCVRPGWWVNCTSRYTLYSRFICEKQGTHESSSWLVFVRSDTCLFVTAEGRMRWEKQQQAGPEDCKVCSEEMGRRWAAVWGAPVVADNLGGTVAEKGPLRGQQ